MPTFPLTVGRRRVVAMLLLALVAAVVAWRHAAAGASPPGGALAVAPIRPSTRAAAQSAVARAGPALVVDVVGAVRRPGLYRLARGARVADAVARAGGLTQRAERDAVNLAAPVADGEQVIVAVRGAAVPAGGAGPPPGAPAAPISLSTASAEQLDTLPGVGPVTAQKIVAYRQEHGPFGSVAELDAIPGIGPARLEELKGLVVP